MKVNNLLINVIAIDNESINGVRTFGNY